MAFRDALADRKESFKKQNTSNTPQDHIGAFSRPVYEGVLRHPIHEAFLGGLLYLNEKYHGSLKAWTQQEGDEIDLSEYEISDDDDEA